MSKQFGYNNLIIKVQRLAEDAKVPKHWSKTCNETFDVHTICLLFVLSQIEQKDYRLFSAWLEIAPALGLKRVPHWTTLQKAFQRLPPRLVRKLMQLSGHCKDRTISLDPTYYQLANPSEGYCKRIKRDSRKDKLRKVSVVCGTMSNMVLDVYLKAEERHGTKDVPELMKSGCFKNKIVLADKEFDSEKFHEQIEEAGGRSIVPLRNNKNVPYHRIKGRHSKALSRKPLSRTYRSRVRSESNNSAVKRIFSPVLRGKTFWQQARDVYGKYLAYNLIQDCMSSFVYWLELSTELFLRIGL